MEYIINIHWDCDVRMWIAISEDVKGLVLESESIDTLMERVRHAVPELLALNNQETHEHTILHFRAEKSERIYA